MAYDKNDRGAQDRACVRAEEGYEVEYFARKHGISPPQARDLIKEFGNDRTKLDAAAERLKESEQRRTRGR